MSAQACINTPDGISIEDTALPSGNCNLEVRLAITVPSSPSPKRIQFQIDYDTDEDGINDATQMYTYAPGGAIPAGLFSLSDISEEFDALNLDCNTVFTVTIIGYTSPGGGGDCTTEIGYVDQNGFSTILPINLTSFNAKVNGDENLIYWTTQGEKDNFAQVVERSENSTDNFREIDRILSAGNTTETRNYSISDRDPLDLSYYRLASIDFDGSVSYSDVSVVERTEANFEITTIYPVPVWSYASVRFNSPKAGPLRLEVSNSVGALIKVIQLDAIQGANITQIDFSDLVSGAYIVTIDDGQKKVQRKLIRH